MQSPPRVEVQAAARVSLLPTVACLLKVQAALAEHYLKPAPEVRRHEEFLCNSICPAGNMEHITLMTSLKVPL